MRMPLLHIFMLAAALSFGMTVYAAGPASELHITQDGKFSATNVVVIQKAGSNLFGRVVWGNAFVRLTIVTTPPGGPAQIIKKNGGSALVDEIQEGDILVVEGSLASGADSLLVNATKVKDLSLTKEPKVVSGTIKSVNSAANTFYLTDKKLGVMLVKVDPMLTIAKGARTIAVGELVVGDKVLSAQGIYDYNDKTFIASTLEIYQDPSVFKARVFEGTLKSIGGTALPTTLTIASGGKDYTVYLASGASILNKARTSADLARFAVGDRVTLNGKIRATNLLEIDATTLRNLNF